jgi:hypothetical protein
MCPQRKESKGEKYVILSGQSRGLKNVYSEMQPPAYKMRRCAIMMVIRETFSNIFLQETQIALRFQAVFRHSWSNE